MVCGCSAVVEGFEGVETSIVEVGVDVVNEVDVWEALTLSGC